MFSRSRLILTAALPFLAIGGFVVACGGGSKDSGSASSSSPTQAPAGTTRPAGGSAQSITIADFSYSPARFNAAAGQQVTVTVRNTGQQAHTFTIKDVVDSGTIAPGETKTVTFTPGGNLIYFCTIHGQALMSGQVIVSGTSGSAPPSLPDGDLVSASVGAD
jgi:plastocyanin